MTAELFGPYRLDARIGRGGMGEVFRAFDTQRNRVVALKRLPPHLALDEEYRARFQRESALVASLNEPHVIPIHDYGEIDGQLFIDMRLVDGGDLGSVLERGRLTVRRAVDVISQIADALDAAHARGLVHRDVKPPNVLFAPSPGIAGYLERGVVYLADFGIARLLDGPTLSQAGLGMGSAGYMAPERFTGDEWGTRVDVYSLACVLYECLVGRRPFSAAHSLPAAMHAHIYLPPPRPSAERPDLAIGFDEVVACGMAKNPEDRYPSPGELAFAARRLLTAGSGPVPRTGSVPVTAPPIPRPQPRLPAAVQPPRVSGPAARYPTAEPALHGPGLRTGVPPTSPTGSGPVLAPRAPGIPRRRVLQVAGGVVAVGVAGGAAWGALWLTGVIGASGRPWTVETGDKVYSSPLVADGVVFIGSNDQLLYALDSRTGTERWRYATAAAVTSSPTIAGGVVYVGSNDQRLHAVDAISGSARWTLDTGGVVHSSPAVVDGVIYVGSRSDALVAADAATGMLRWRFRGGGWFNSSPAVAAGIVYVGCRDTNIYAIDAAEGRENWRYPTASSVDSSPTIVDRSVYIGTDDRRVLALDAFTGALTWSFAAAAGVVSTPAVSEGALYVGSDDGILYALEADTGRERWRFATGGGIRSSPAVADGIVYVGSHDRVLYAVDARTGTSRWRFETPGGVDDSSPAVANGMVYIGSLGGTVHALDARSGASG